MKRKPIWPRKWLRAPKFLALFITTMLALSVASALPAAAESDPPGNNGTVKIDGVEFDSHPDNQPHVGCTFQVDFYGFDEGVGNATVTFELQPPTDTGRTLTVTSGDLTPDIGEDPAGGGTDVDAQETYTLAFTGAPDPQQGYHIMLTVNAPGSQGSDIKHKTFWVEACAPTPTPADGDLSTSCKQIIKVELVARSDKDTVFTLRSRNKAGTAVSAERITVKAGATKTVYRRSFTGARVSLWQGGKRLDRVVVPKPCVDASIRAYCVTENFGEGVARLINRHTNKSAPFRIVRSGPDRRVWVKASDTRMVELRGLRVGSWVKVYSGGKLLAKAKVRGGCGEPHVPDTGLRTGATSYKAAPA